VKLVDTSEQEKWQKMQAIINFGLNNASSAVSMGGTFTNMGIGGQVSMQDMMGLGNSMMGMSQNFMNLAQTFIDNPEASRALQLMSGMQGMGMIDTWAHDMPRGAPPIPQPES